MSNDLLSSLEESEKDREALGASSATISLNPKVTEEEPKDLMAELTASEKDKSTFITKEEAPFIPSSPTISKEEQEDTDVFSDLEEVPYQFFRKGLSFIGDLTQMSNDIVQGAGGFIYDKTQGAAETIGNLTPFFDDLQLPRMEDIDPDGSRFEQTEANRINQWALDTVGMKDRDPAGPYSRVARQVGGEAPYIVTGTYALRTLSWAQLATKGKVAGYLRPYLDSLGKVFGVEATASIIGNTVDDQIAHADYSDGSFPTIEKYKTEIGLVANVLSSVTVANLLTNAVYSGAYKGEKILDVVTKRGKEIYGSDYVVSDSLKSDVLTGSLFIKPNTVATDTLETTGAKLGDVSAETAYKADTILAERVTNPSKLAKDVGITVAKGAGKALLSIVDKAPFAQAKILTAWLKSTSKEAYAAGQAVNFLSSAAQRDLLSSISDLPKFTRTLTTNMDIANKYGLDLDIYELTGSAEVRNYSLALNRAAPAKTQQRLESNISKLRKSLDEYHSRDPEKIEDLDTTLKYLDKSTLESVESLLKTMEDQRTVIQEVLTGRKAVVQTDFGETVETSPNFKDNLTLGRELQESVIDSFNATVTSANRKYSEVYAGLDVNIPTNKIANLFNELVVKLSPVEATADNIPPFLGDISKNFKLDAAGNYLKNTLDPKEMLELYNNLTVASTKSSGRVARNNILEFKSKVDDILMQHLPDENKKLLTEARSWYKENVANMFLKTRGVSDVLRREFGEHLEGAEESLRKLFSMKDVNTCSLGRQASFRATDIGTPTQRIGWYANGDLNCCGGNWLDQRQSIFHGSGITTKQGGESVQCTLLCGN